MNDIRICHSLETHHLPQLSDLYQDCWPELQRSPEDLAKMLTHTSYIIALMDESDHLVGFVRVLTDFIYKALVLDVMVHSSRRGQRLGELLFSTLIQDPLLKSVRHIELYCLDDMIGFYSRWDFKTPDEEMALLRRYVPRPEEL